MKKIIIVLMLLFTVALTTTSCKKEAPKKEVATVLYQCPMDCEKGKSYTEVGTCPVCKMDLKAKKPAESHEHKKGDDHTH